MPDQNLKHLFKKARKTDVMNLHYTTSFSNKVWLVYNLLTGSFSSTVAVFLSPSETVNIFPVGFTYTKRQNTLLRTHHSNCQQNNIIISTCTFSTWPTKHTGRLMYCDSIEQFTLGLGTSRMPAIFTTYSYGVVAFDKKKNEAAARGKPEWVYLVYYGSPRRRSFHTLVWNTRGLASKAYEVIKSSASFPYGDTSAVHRDF